MLGINSESILVTLEFDSPYPTAKQVCQFCSNMTINKFSVEPLLRIIKADGLLEAYIESILVTGAKMSLFCALYGVSRYKACKIRNLAIAEIQLHWQEIKGEFGL